MWRDYTHKMMQLIPSGAYLAGVFFLADKAKGPPFGTSRDALQQLFGEGFALRDCQPVGAPLPVFAGQEFWMVWQRKPAAGSELAE